MTLNNFILPTDVLSTIIDEPSIITYVSTFFQHCSTTDEVNISFFFFFFFLALAIQINFFLFKNNSAGHMSLAN